MQRAYGKREEGEAVKALKPSQSKAAQRAQRAAARFLLLHSGRMAITSNTTNHSFPTGACALQVQTFLYGGTPVTIKEGDLGSGVGARVWTVAHMLCRELAAHPSIVRGQRVLEIGAGCGVCGILAAKLGAEAVVLTDYCDPVLLLLRECMHLNAAHSGEDGCAGNSGQNGTRNSAQTAGQAGHEDRTAGGVAAKGGPIGEAEAAGLAAEGCPSGEAVLGAELDPDWDPEDASECSDLDELLVVGLGGGAVPGGLEVGEGGSRAVREAQQAQQASWDSVSFLGEWSWGMPDVHGFGWGAGRACCSSQGCWLFALWRMGGGFVERGYSCMGRAPPLFLHGAHPSAVPAWGTPLHSPPAAVDGSGSTHLPLASPDPDLWGRRLCS
jgi:hypothetical protein